MKRIFFILIIVLFINKTSNAQNWWPPTPGFYKTNNTMTSFHGTWQWSNGADTVKIYLTTQKVFYSIDGGFYWDNIVGWHLYKKGNQLIESSFPYINTSYTNGQSTIKGTNELIGSNKLDCDLKDISKNKTYEVKLTLNAALNQLTWQSVEVGRGYTGSQTVPPQGITLPRSMVFIKQ